jgi:fatty-acyl-CoA synthase
MSGTINDALVWWARITPDSVAVDFDGDAITYRALSGWADGVAAELQAKGVRPGDRVSLLGSNSLEWCAVALGAWRLGAIVAPFNHRMLSRELTALVEDCEPAAVYCDAALRDRLEEVHRARPTFEIGLLDDVTKLRGGGHKPIATPVGELSDPTAIIFTSGTTGRPKGVIFTHGSIAGEMHEWSLIEPIQPNGLRALLVLPLFTAAGVIWGLARCLLHGGTLLLQPSLAPARAPPSPALPSSSSRSPRRRASPRPTSPASPRPMSAARGCRWNCCAPGRRRASRSGRSTGRPRSAVRRP